MDIETQKDHYAEVIIRHGLNVQPGQLVNISTEVYHREFTLLLARKAYEAGAKYVDIEFSDPKFGRLRVEQSTEEMLRYVPRSVAVKCDEIVETHAANLKLTGSEFPEILTGLDPKKVNTARLAGYQARKRFYDEGIGRRQVHWTVAAAPTPNWAMKVFPDLDAQQAEQKLWQAILQICRCDTDDALKAWHDHNVVLHHRAKALTEMKIDSLHFQGPGTDLRVGLSEIAVFIGGTDRGPLGVDYEPNIPTEECFTTPDYRRTEGSVRATRPFLVNGTLIEGLEVTFSQGKITDFRADKGKDVFGEYIGSDEGACRLGEVALVGVDSPVYRSGLVFEEILFDENAACHIAVGSAYKFCLKDGDTMPKDQLEEFGCNDSSVHTDIMISSEEVGVDAVLRDGSTRSLIQQGEWLAGL